eukprot:m.445106 g.445106  ORF g.445106 m.445106 type:complete len:74 (-) comp142709_c0_seq1:300-521(-)
MPNFHHTNTHRAAQRTSNRVVGTVMEYSIVFRVRQTKHMEHPARMAGKKLGCPALTGGGFVRRIPADLSVVTV